MNTFKIGDKVYFPKDGNKVFTIEDDERSILYPLGFGGNTFTRNGRYCISDTTPSLYHATPENKAKLEAFYGIPFESAPYKPTPKEIIQARLDSGELSVPCWVSSVDKQPATRNTWMFIRQIVDEDQPFVDEQGSKWKYATPFNHATLQPITELPVGEYYE